jgi:hypothetical protein
VTIASKGQAPRGRGAQENGRFVEVNGTLIERDAGVSMAQRFVPIGNTGRASREVKGALPDHTRAVIV